MPWARPTLIALASLAIAPQLPFPRPARVRAPGAAIWSAPKAGAQVIGSSQTNATVQVAGCAPSCDEASGWALLVEGGAVRLSQLELGADAGTPPPLTYAYRLAWPRGDAGVPVRSRPSAKAPVVEWLGRRVVAIERDDAVPAGWVRRAEGSGFIASRGLPSAEVPSALVGEPQPELPLAFVYRSGATLVGDAGTAPLARYWRGAVREERRPVLAVDGGTVSRRFVRVARAHVRPEAVPIDARWVHVDPAEQTLVAYEGDRPVFATLVSTGVPEFPTHLGLHPVWLKMRHERMHGDDYFVEEVPFIQYFRGGEGLHGAFWHDHFGRPASHGCVNLSMADAAWLFDWAPPALPPGWHSLYPERAGVPGLWVLVEPSHPRIPTAPPIASGN